MEKYNAFTKCENTLDKMRGSNNIAANHGGKLSPYSKKFVKYQDVDNVEEIISNLGKTASETARKNNNLIGSYDYYLSRGYTKEEAFEMKSKKVFSLAKCIEKYGEEEGYNVWCKRQEKWLNSFRKNNYSKISQELFDEIYKHYNQTEIHYATKDKTINKNQEYRLKLIDGTFVLPDFICIDTKKIIEFDGEYWHNENLANPKRRTDRDERIIASGYTIFHVKEYDFKRNREQVIFECLNYLN